MSDNPRKLLQTGLSKSLESVLHGQTIEPGNPGPILRDAQSLIDAIGDGIPTTSKYFALPQGKLDMLNQGLSEPLVHGLKRPQLRSFPTLMGLFLVLRASGLAIGVSKPKRVVMIDPVMLEQWDSLSPTEQYMSLLGAWLTTATWDAVGERQSYSDGMSSEMQTVYLKLETTVTELSDDRYGMFYGVTDAVTLAMLHQFGWIQTAYESVAKDGKTANLRTIQRRPLGDAMFAAICKHSLLSGIDQPELDSILKPYFPTWQHTLTLPDPEFLDAQYTLKLALGTAWRRLVAPSETSLDDLAELLLAAFNFNNDHLYQFELRDQLGKRFRIVGPMIDDAEYFTEDFCLGELPLDEGDSMTFVFDFGDNWRFTITIEEIDEDCKHKSPPKITKESGTPPEQYEHENW